MSDRRRPFHCGTQAADWDASNCEAGPCRRFHPGEPDNCEIAVAIGEAFWGDGTVSPEIAVRMGLPGNECALVWPCPEHDPPWEFKDDSALEQPDDATTANDTQIAQKS